jgi:acetyl esterase/lipase
MGAAAAAIVFWRVDMVCLISKPEEILGMTTQMKMTIAGILLLGCGIILFAGCTSFQILNSTISKSGYVSTLDVAYGNDARQKLDVYRPKKAGNGKVVIFFYGGSWRTGSKTDYKFVAQALTSRGFIAVLPDYRVYPEVTFPKFVEDGAASVRWVHDNISKFGGDTNQIYLMGHSAGSHIAALLTLDAHYLKEVGLDRKVIRATAGLSGPYDFTPNPWDRPVFGLATNDTYINPQIEPIHFVDGKEPPMLLIQGLRDKIVAPSNAMNLAARIRETGGQVELITYSNRAHATVALALASKFHWLAPVLDDVTDYFNRH